MKNHNRCLTTNLSPIYLVIQIHNLQNVFVNINNDQLRFMNLKEALENSI